MTYNAIWKHKAREQLHKSATVQLTVFNAPLAQLLKWGSQLAYSLDLEMSDQTMRTNYLQSQLNDREWYRFCLVKHIKNCLLNLAQVQESRDVLEDAIGIKYKPCPPRLGFHIPRPRFAENEDWVARCVREIDAWLEANHPESGF